MPLTIDEERFGKLETLDLTQPQNSPHGIPVKQIPHLEFPLCVYKHPAEPFFVRLHRNAQHEVVDREMVAAEHKIHICQNKKELDRMLAQGYVREPYIPQAPPDPTEALYSTGAGTFVRPAQHNLRPAPQSGVAPEGE